MGNAIVIGAGPGGLTAGMVLAGAGLSVIVLDKDADEPPATADSAWETWRRAGVSQFRQPHGLIPAGYRILDENLPAVLDHLEALGARRFGMADAPPPSITDWSPEPEDERFTTLAARRPVIELAFAMAARETPDLEVRRGVTVTELITGARTLNGAPHIVGVRTDTGETIKADLVVDAGGRRSPAPGLLEDVGARRPSEVGEDCRFIYHTRFYRKRDEADFPQPYVLSIFPAGSVSIVTIPGDNDTWSVTIYGTTADRALRAARDPAVFERVIRAHPLRSHFLDAEPITDVVVMAGISDRERSVVVEGSPVATGIIPVADAWACTNPSLGRGIGMGLMHVLALLPVITTTLHDPAELAHAWDAITRQQLQPWHLATLETDRARNREMDAMRSSAADGELPAPSPEETAFLAATLTDATMFRARLEIASLLATPAEVMSRPEVQRMAAAAADDLPDLPAPEIPTRSELESLLS